MTISLQTLTSGDTAYIAKHNSNYSKIQGAINPMQADVNALKAAGSAGADLDFRLATMNLAINGGLDYWQRGANSRPDGWQILSGSPTIARSTTKKINTYSAKVVGTCQLAQDLPDEIRKSSASTISYSFGAYVKTDTASQARIGIYNGTTTQYSSYHSGSDDWELLTVNATFSSEPDSLRLILDSASGTNYFNALVLIRGNPSAGPIFVANDPVLERIRVNSLYETGTTNMRGVGFLNDGDRELEERIEFIAPKKSTPLVTIDEDDTGYDFLAYNVDRHGFSLLVAEVGGASGSNGFEYNSINWTAEVVGT